MTPWLADESFVIESIFLKIAPECHAVRHVTANSADDIGRDLDHDV